MIIASPFVEAGSVIRPDESSEYPFDHTSIIRTVFDLFCGTDEHLARRDKIAPSLAPCLGRTDPRPDLGPKKMHMPRKPPPFVPPPEQKVGRDCHSVAHLQRISA